HEVERLQLRPEQEYREGLTAVLTVAVAGAAGYVGSNIVAAFRADSRYSVIPVVRGDSFEERIAKADIVVHAANPARRFQAEQDPHRDFEETVEKTARL